MSIFNTLQPMFLPSSLLSSRKNSVQVKPQQDLKLVTQPENLKLEKEFHKKPQKFFRFKKTKLKTKVDKLIFINKLQDRSGQKDL